MRKVSLVVTAAAVSGLLAIASVASADIVQSFNVNVSPAKKSKSKTKQAGVAIEISTRTDTNDGTSPPAVSNVQIGFPKGWIFNTSAFPTCDPASLNAQKEAACSKAKVGSGSAEVKAFSLSNPATPPIVAQAEVIAYNGTPSGGKPRILLQATTTEPVTTRTLLIGTLNGTKLNLPIQITNPIPDSKIVITKFAVKVKKLKAKAKAAARIAAKKGKKKSKKGGKKAKSDKYYIAAPDKCSGSWPFTSNFQFADGQSKQVSAQVKCTK